MNRKELFEMAELRQEKLNEAKMLEQDMIKLMVDDGFYEYFSINFRKILRDAGRR